MRLIDRIYNESESFFDRWESKLKKAIIKFLVSNLILKGEKIETSNSNWVTLSAIDGLGEERSVRNFMLKNLKKIIQEEIKRYSEYGRLEEKQKTVDSFLERYNREDDKVLSKYYTKVRNDTLNKIIQGATLTEVREYVNESNVGYKQFAEHTYTLYQRTASNTLRKSVGLKYATYEGGVINNTREFCRERDGKVFSEDEILNWGLLEWEGKPDIYNPFTDCGGYNCRHRLNWISEELAQLLRDE